MTPRSSGRTSLQGFFQPQRDCPFCQRIANGDYQDCGDYTTVTFIPLNPVIEGHRLFVPRVAPHTVVDAMRSLSASCIGFAMEAAAKHGYRVGQDFNLILNYGTAATQTISHPHVHYVPRAEGDGLRLPWTGQVKS